MRNAALLAVMMMCLTGCVSTPEWYKIPAQQGPVGPPEPVLPAYGNYFRAIEPGSQAYIVKDVLAGESHFRWTNASPELHFYPKTVENPRFRMVFGVNDETFRNTGPLGIVFHVNGHELARVRYTAPGQKTFEKAVPAHWLKANDENRVIIEILNPWTAPDGVVLGVTLFEAGFPD